MSRPPKAPKIVIGPDEERVGDEAIEALSRCNDVFVHGGHLARVVDHSASTGTVRIEPLPPARLRELLSRCARWETPGDEERPAQPTHVPPWVVRAVAARSEWPGLRLLKAIVTTPVVRPDGTITGPGYDAATGVYLTARGRTPAVADVPSVEDVARSCAGLRSVGAMLGLGRDGELAAWTAMLMTPLVRHAFAGPAPLFGLIADEGIAGLSLLSLTCALVHHVAPERVDMDALVKNPGKVLADIRGEVAFIHLARFGESGWPTQARALEVLQAEPAARRFTWLTVMRRREVRAEFAARVVVVGSSRDAADERSRVRAGVWDLDPAKVCAQVLTLAVAHARRRGRQPLRDDITLRGWSSWVDDAVAEAGLPRLLAITPTPALDPEEHAADLLIETITAARSPVTVRRLLVLLREQGAATRHLRDALEHLEPGVFEHPRASQRLGHLLARLARVPRGTRELVLLSSGADGNRWVARPRVGAAD